MSLFAVCVQRSLFYQEQFAVTREHDASAQKGMDRLILQLLNVRFKNVFTNQSSNLNGLNFRPPFSCLFVL